MHTHRLGHAQSYPTKPITIVVPLAAGTGMDCVARLYGDQLAQALGKPVMIENRPGAALTLAPAEVAQAPADGYTLMVSVTGTFAALPLLYKKVGYDPKDFIAIALYLKSPFVLVVNPQLPVHSVPTSSSSRRSRRRGSPTARRAPARCSTSRSKSIKQRFGFDLMHVPYRNTPQSVTDIVAGHVGIEPGRSRRFGAADPGRKAARARRHLGPTARGPA